MAPFFEENIFWYEKKCQKTAMLLHGISDTSYNLRQRMPPDMASHAGIYTVSSMIYALHISLPDSRYA